MADTGLPWELPYPLPTDLVRDGADAIKDLAEATATGLSAAGSEGIGPNVVSATKTNVFTTTSTTFVPITDLDVTITPSSDTSKVLVIATLTVSCTATNQNVFLQLMRGSTPVGNGSEGFGLVRVSNTLETYNPTVVFLDSPTTDSATTYSVEIASSGATSVVNSRGSAQDIFFSSSITAIEVAA